jgi:hypothetical protein
MLDAIIDGMVNPEDFALRDYSSSLLQTYLTWTIKQAPGQAALIHTFKQLTKRLYNLAQHGNSFKRLGATTAFSSLLTIFQEEAVLVDTFAFEMLVNLILCLRLSQNDDVSLDTRASAEKAIRKLAIIVERWAHMLCKDSARRRPPLTWDCRPSMKTMVSWLFSQFKIREEYARVLCIELFDCFIKLLEPENSSAAWIKTCLKPNGLRPLLENFEALMRDAEQRGDTEDWFSLAGVLLWLFYAEL